MPDKFWNSPCRRECPTKNRRRSFWLVCRQPEFIETAIDVVATIPERRLARVNHALFFTDLALRKEAGFGIIPDYQAAILDECHTIESVASSHLGLKITNGQVQYALNKLYNPRPSRSTKR